MHVPDPQVRLGLRPRRSARALSSARSVGRRRARGPVVVVATLALGAVSLAACSSSGSSSPTSSTVKPATSPSGASLQSLQDWPTTSVSLSQTGSTLLYPLFNAWVAQTQKQWPNVKVTTAATGSGTGISSAASGTVNIGASDAYLSPAEVQANPGLMNIPLAVSAQQVDYNLPGVGGHLKLDAKVLAEMYEGKITTWNDSAIAALNPGVSLPATHVVPVHRVDSSGDTFLFSSFLATADPSGWTIAPGTTVAWPNVPGELGATGNGGMVSTCKANPGCVAYIGISYLKDATAAGLGYAALKNKSGSYELPTQPAIVSAAAGFADKTPSTGTLSMIYGDAPNGYPIVNYEYAIVRDTQPTSSEAQAIRALLAWAIDPSEGSAPSYLDAVGFVALPGNVRTISVNLLAKIS